MRRALLLAIALAAPCLAQAAGFDAPGLARFDTGYARCEARFAHMKGARDEAYLAVYRVKADAKAHFSILDAIHTPASTGKAESSSIASSFDQQNAGCASQV